MSWPRRRDTIWFAPYFNFIYQNADVIRAVAYINARWDDQAMRGRCCWGNTRVQVSENTRQAWQAELCKERWLHSQAD